MTLTTQSGICKYIKRITIVRERECSKWMRVGERVYTKRWKGMKEERRPGQQWVGRWEKIGE